jgi:hypothetical protein
VSVVIYIVAGKRNCLPGAVADNGGLWADVGQTERSVEKRLQDDDYRRKNSSGGWRVLAEVQVTCGVTDHEVHRFLKEQPGVRWRQTDNTEEFLFLGDPGDGSVAKKLVEGFLEGKSLQLALCRVSELTGQNRQLEAIVSSDEGQLRASLVEESCRLAETNQKCQERLGALGAQQSQLEEQKKFYLSQRWQRLLAENFNWWSHLFLLVVIAVAVSQCSYFFSEAASIRQELHQALSSVAHCEQSSIELSKVLEVSMAQQGSAPEAQQGSAPEAQQGLVPDYVAGDCKKHSPQQEIECLNIPRSAKFCGHIRRIFAKNCLGIAKAKVAAEKAANERAQETAAARPVPSAPALARPTEAAPPRPTERPWLVAFGKALKLAVGLRQEKESQHRPRVTIDDPCNKGQIDVRLQQIHISDGGASWPFRTAATRSAPTPFISAVTNQ